MKAVIALIFLTILLIQISVFAQSEESPASERNMLEELSSLSQLIDLYFDEMIALKAKLSASNQKITSPNLSPEDAEKARYLQESRENIYDILKIYNAEIVAELGSSPETLEAFETAKLQYNIAVIKAIMPRFETPKASLLTRMLTTLPAQYVEEILPRAEALNLIFTQFESNEPSKDAMNLQFRLNEMIKTHNKLAEKLNQQKEAKIYQIYPLNSKVTTATQEAALYEALVKSSEFQPAKAAPSPSLLTTTKTGIDTYTITTTCSGLFGI